MTLRWPARRQVVAWSVSAGVHVLVLLVLALLSPSWEGREAPAPALNVQISLGRPPQPAPSPKTPAESQPPPEEAMSRASIPASRESSPVPPVSERSFEPTVAPQPPPSKPPSLEPPAEESAPASDLRPVFDLSGLDEIQVTDPSSASTVSRQRLSNDLGDIELQGSFTELRANPPRPQLRNFQNAYGTVIIHFVVRDSLLGLQEIKFVDGAVAALPDPEKDRLRNELRNWLRAWSLLGARDGSVGKITLRLVSSSY